MDKEKEIEEMAKVISKAECYEDKIAEALVNAGYGNVKQAVKEFAEKVEDIIERNVQGLEEGSDKKYDDKQKVAEGVGRFYAKALCLAIIREQKELYGEEKL